MISDTLSDAAAQVREYLTHDTTCRCYTDSDARRLIIAALEAMDAARTYLDTPPRLDP